MYSFKDLIERFNSKDLIPTEPQRLLTYYKFLKNAKTGTYNEKHHILPISIFPELRNDYKNLKNISACNHFRAHYYLALAFPGCLLFQIAFFLMSGYKRYARSISKTELPAYEKIYNDGKEHSAHLSRERLLGKILVKDSTGVIFSVKNTDSRLQSGELIPAATGTQHTKGYVWRLTPEDERIFIPENDPRVVSGELIIGRPQKYQHYTKGKIVAYDEHNKHVIIENENDPRVLSGQLVLTSSAVHPSKNTVGVHDAVGNLLFVSPDDFRIGNGSLTLGRPGISSNTGKVVVYDKTNKVSYVQKDDPRLSTGELFRGIPESLKQKRRERIFSPSNKGRVAVTLPSGNLDYINPDDPRISSGEVTLGVPIGLSTSGKIRTFNLLGSHVYVFSDDPRLTSGELTLDKPKNFRFHLKGRIGAVDPVTKAVYRVFPDDSRLKTGELMIQRPAKRIYKKRRRH